MAPEPVFKHFAQRPTTATVKNPLIPFHSLIRDQFPITTWLLIGALLQGVSHVLLPYPNIALLLPALLVLTYKAGKTLLILASILPNPSMSNVIQYRTTPSFPSRETGAQDNGSARRMCAILLSVVSHHPLGMLAPGYREVGRRFDEMMLEVSESATIHGFLGASGWMGAHERTAGNEFATIMYFENEECVHAYAHGEMHTRTMKWWRETEKEHGHVGIMHEVFACPEKGWEGVYLNYFPTGLGATSMEVTGPEGEKEWVNPLVKAKGKLVYSKGRMGRAYNDKEWEAFGATLGTEDGM
ncbi:hypothetical protein GQ44DRAFT_724463 [Phaeosphaeriaceae sp. PMI808]|nr:hypothetical protein GQ44DRAFT_724463 [Phaeosphaeriaceae sp. PMI808]